MVSPQQSMNMHYLVQKLAKLSMPFHWVGMSQSSNHTWLKRSEIFTHLICPIIHFHLACKGCFICKALFFPENYNSLLEKMGEQSVGKSFALNHLVDTSFAGSAMRTTGNCSLSPWYRELIFISIVEGVWLSVTPTKDYLVVALDFEGFYFINIQQPRLM